MAVGGHGGAYMLGRHGSTRDLFKPYMTLRIEEAVLSVSEDAAIPATGVFALTDPH